MRAQATGGWEGIKDNKLVAPKNVTASVEQGKIKVEITPSTLQEAGVDPSSTDPATVCVHGETGGQ